MKLYHLITIISIYSLFLYWILAKPNFRIKHKTKSWKQKIPGNRDTWYMTEAVFLIQKKQMFFFYKTIITHYSKEHAEEMLNQLNK